MVEEVDPAVLKRTQEILGSVIRKPPLAEKNLKRPPFRFLHDIITNVIKATGFMRGLYSPEEMSSENIKDKDSKIAFLQKTIDLLTLVANQPINVKPSKIVAGHEAQKTNEFLQILGTAAKSKIDTQEAVQTVLEKSGATPSQKGRRASVDKRPGQKATSEKSHLRSTTKTIEPAKKSSSQASSSKESTKSKDADKLRSRSKDSKSREKEKPKEKTRLKRDDSKSRISKSESKREKPKHIKDDEEVAVMESPVKRPTALQNGTLDMGGPEDDDVEEMPSIAPVKSTEEDKPLVNGESVGNDIESPVKREVNDTSATSQEVFKPEEKHQRAPSGHVSRPPSARSKRLKSGVESDLKTEAAASSLNPEPHPSLDLRRQNGAASPLARPPSARPSSSRPAPPRIRIRHIVENEEPSVRPETAKPVENLILDQKQLSEDEDEDETYIVAEDKVETAVEDPPLPTLGPQETPDEDKGSLVRQLLATKKDLEGGSQQHPSMKVEIDKSQLAQNKMRESANKELEQLRSYIQNVSKTAYPLGRMLDYLQEDVDSMRAELKMWRDEHRQNLMALRKEKSITESVLEPLRIQLDDLDQLVQDQLDANGALKSTILRNEEKIQRMLTGIQKKS